MHKKHIILLSVLLVVLTTVYLSLLSVKNGTSVGVTADNGKGNDNSLPGGISARLTGHGESTNLNFKITIAAVINANKDIAGGISGQTVTFKSFKGVVTEVVPPTIDKDYWCINSIIRDPESAVGINWIWFVKDVGQAGDQVSFASGLDLNCSNVGEPVQPFEPLTKGDFKGEVRN